MHNTLNVSIFTVTCATVAEPHVQHDKRVPSNCDLDISPTTVNCASKFRKPAAMSTLEQALASKPASGVKRNVRQVYPCPCLLSPVAAVSDWRLQPSKTRSLLAELAAQ